MWCTVASALIAAQRDVHSRQSLHRAMATAACQLRRSRNELVPSLTGGRFLKGEVK